MAHVLVRQRKFGMRHALGATPARLVRQIGVEAAAMGAVSVAIGAALAPLLIDTMTALWTSALPRQQEIALLLALLRFDPLQLALTVAAIAWPHVRLAARSAAPAVASARVAGHRADRPRVARTLAPQRFRAILVASLAGLASVLATCGVCSVTAFTVAAQARELAIRVVLGETRGGARRRVVLASLRPAAAGALLGAGAAWASSRFVESFLFEIRADDPRALAAAPTALILFALVAAWVPAAKAARLDPAAVLRDGDRL